MEEAKSAAVYEDGKMVADVETWRVAPHEFDMGPALTAKANEMIEAFERAVRDAIDWIATRWGKDYAIENLELRRTIGARECRIYNTAFDVLVWRIWTEQSETAAADGWKHVTITIQNEPHRPGLAKMMGLDHKEADGG